MSERCAPFPEAEGGGKRPSSLGHQERVASQRHGDMVVPSDERAALVVVETELSLEVFVGPLDSPSVLGGPDQVLDGGGLGKGRERVFAGLRLTVGPLDQQPLRH